MTSGSPEELRDLVLGEGGQRFAPAAAHQREALAALHDLADEVTVDALARERVDLGLLLARDDRRALERHALGEHHRVADARAARRHEPVLRDLAEHRADDDRAVEAVRDLRVATDERHVELIARRVELVEERRDRGLGGRAGWKQERREEPTRTRAAYGDVIGVDLERVPADLVGGERDRVGGGHEIAVAHVDDRRVLTDLRTDDDAGIPERVLVEDRLQRLGTKLADWQELHAAE